jgi:hypothetical protein
MRILWQLVEIGKDKLPHKLRFRDLLIEQGQNVPEHAPSFALPMYPFHQ